MDEDVDFFCWQVPDLKRYLQERGIQCSLRRKLELVRLCELANELQLEIITSHITESEYVDFERNRRTVTVGVERVTLEPMNKIEEWNKDLSKIPDVESFDVLVYLMNKCGWSADRLTNYKKDNGYRLSVANHIDSVQVSCGLHSEFIYLKCTCVPETRQSAEPYIPWILLRSTSGEIISGGCTCVADNGACKHCVAFLFSLASFCERHQDRSAEVCTDVPCMWDKPRKKTMPSTITSINTRIDQSNPPPVVPTPDNYDPRVPSHGIMSNEQEFYNLCKGTHALLLETLYSEDMDSENGDEDCTDVTMEEVFKTNRDELTGDMCSINEKLREIFNTERIGQIEESTRGQSENSEWFAHRKGRITASIFSSVKHFRFTESQENYISKQIMGRSTRRVTPAMSFGTLNEPIARHQYFEKYKHDHKKADLQLCGLFIDPDYPYLGASPDALVKCKCCGEGLLEIKCSFLYQNKDPKEACMDDHYHVTLDENENIRLKIDSPWYIQIQGQLGVCHRNWCDFVFFTKKGFVVDRIYFDEEIYKNIVIKASKFFERYIIPALQAS